MNKVANRRTLSSTERGDMLVLNLLNYLSPDPDTETFLELLGDHQLSERLQAGEAVRRLIRRGAIEVFQQ